MRLRVCYLRAERGASKDFHDRTSTDLARTHVPIRAGAFVERLQRLRGFRRETPRALARARGPDRGVADCLVPRMALDTGAARARRCDQGGLGARRVRRTVDTREGE